MKQPRKTFVGQQTQRHDRFIRERVHDPYKTRLKMHEPTICQQCGAVWSKGRWQWMQEQPGDAEEELCQACHRVNDRYPAGELRLSGSYFKAHRDEILNLARNTQQTETDEHPLHRIITINEQDDMAVITTTDIHLPRRIGQAIFDACSGEFNFDYDKDGYFIRASWYRDD
ncbi:MAG: BCAM0308 family protein [Hyphomicrobiales bacterium]|nr:BCAM0308 family protein [Hyphomicrobiales bacterium]